MKNLVDGFSSRPMDVSTLVSADERRRRLLNIMCVAMIATMFVFGFFIHILAFIVPQLLDSHIDMLDTSMLATLIGSVLIIYVNMINRGPAASILFITLLWAAIAVSDPINEILYGRSVITLALPIIVACTLLRPPGGFVITLITAAGMIFVSMFQGFGIPYVAGIAALLLISLLTSLSTSQTELAIEHLQKANQALLEKEASLEYRVRERTTELRIANGKFQAEVAERKRAEMILRESETRFSTIFRNSPVGIGIIRLSDGCFVDVNDAVLDFSGYTRDQIVGHNGTELGFWIYPEERNKAFEELRTKGHVRDFEAKLGGKSGAVSDYLLSLELMDLNGEKQVLGTAVDITERKRVELTLKESESRFSTVFRTSPVGIGMIRLDNNRFVDVNEAFLRLSEYARDEIVGHTALELDLWTFPEEREKLFKELEINGRVSEFEARFRRKSGTISNYLISLEVIDLNGEKHLLGTLVDIGQRKKLEAKLEKANTLLESRVEKRTLQLRKSRDKLQELTRRIVTAQEEERRRVALELHDDAGQALVALQFSLDTVYEELPVNLRKIRQRIKKTSRAAEEMIGRIRILAYSLRPPLLDLMGLDIGVRNLCEEFADQAGIKVDYVGRDLPDVDDEISICLYRFVQEALTNVVKHARATMVEVSINHKAGNVTASVLDNGQGIKLKPNIEGLGLVGVRERLGLVGGRLEIKSMKGKGTQMIANVPLKMGKREPADSG